MIYILTILINLLLGSLVFFSNKRRKVNVFFSFLVLSIILWIITLYFFYSISDPQPVLFLGRLNFVSAIWIAYFVYIFSKNYPKNFSQNENQKLNRLLLIETLLLSAVTLFTDLVDKEEIIDGPYRETVFGPLYYLFITHFFCYISFSIYSLVRKSKKVKGVEKAQLLYLEWGFFLGAILGATTNIILPVMGNYDFQSIGPISTVFFVGSTAYAIIRHRLLDIRFVITRSLIYGALITLIGFLFIFILFISSQFFGGSSISRNVEAFLVAILIVFGLDPLKRLLSRATDKVFFKAKIDYQVVLRKLSETLSFEIDQTKLITDLRETLTQELKIKFAATLLRKSSNGGTEKFEALPDLLSINPNLSLRNDSPLIKYLREHRHAAIFESLERKIDDTKAELRGPLLASKDEFERLGAALITPVYAQDHLIAVLILGPKLSGDTFSNDDVNLIEVLSPQIGSAIQKANLFEEVRQFSESLKIKVAEATAELRERNVSLQTLQNITKEITRTLDFNIVVQKIADSVATELGYVGAILAFLDDDGRTSRARAITQTPITKKAIKLLPKPFSEYATDITDAAHGNLATRVYQTGKIQTASSFAEVVSPPLPKLLANTIQKLVGIKSLVLVPVVSEGKTIGVMEIGTRKAADDIDKEELETMQAVADELGVVSRNLRLFEQIQKTNKKLEVANAHLQELDKAKSEFVSIASHQLRTPMTGIMGYLSMMTQGDFGKLKPEHSQILTNLLAESQRMIRLINQFLNVSKIEAGKFTYTKKPAQIVDLIDAEIREVSKVANDKGLKLVWRKPKVPLPMAMVDPDKIQDVILNLIDNAIKYTAQGTVTITVGVDDGSIHVRVKDTGIGIKPKDATELFNKFVRGSGIAQIHPDGSGLGLFIAKSIIDSHGGRIWVESEGEGRGSTFQFVIPIQPPESSRPSGHDAAAQVTSTKRV